MHPKKETLSPKRTYAFKRVQIHSAKTEQPEIISALYIGLDFWKIYPLLSGFTSTGFAVNFQSAIHTLGRLAHTSNAYAVVLLDASLPLADIEHFLCDISTQPYFSRLVVIGDVSKCSPDQLKLLKKVKHIDDLVELNEPELLKNKTLFFQKIKLADRDMAARNVQTHMSLPKLSLAILQRAFDLVFSSLLLVVLAPVFLILALLVRVDSPGPVFVLSNGRGSRYQSFRFIKFRTTVPLQAGKLSELQLNNADTDQPIHINLDEVQLTRMGHFLKSTNLDELPSLVNVLLGDISFLGNRMA